MYFNVKDFPKFSNPDSLRIFKHWSYNWSFERLFVQNGFETYKFTNESGHWLDDEEFTLFVLRYS